MGYEEKLNLAKKALEYGSYDKSTIEYIFPELKESEEERVKRILYSILSKISSLRDIFTEEEFQYFDAWSNAYFREKSDKLQGKLSIEPKFKVGDWIANNKGHAFLIGAIEGNKYLFEDGGYTHEQLNWEFIENADKCYNLWSFDKNAEDGDVLVYNNNIIDNLNYIFIYKKDKLYQAYCYYSNRKDDIIMEDGKGVDFVWIKSSVMPATKKQRDFLWSELKKKHYE